MTARRVFLLWTIYIVLSAVLLGRLFVLCLWPHGQGLFHSSSVRWQDSLRTRAHLEHLNGYVTDDARGHILFRAGQPIYPQASGSSAENTVVGKVGLPDRWPEPGKVVAEQGRSGLEARFDELLTGTRPGYVGAMKVPAGLDFDSAIYRVAPIRGADLRTTLDARWQKEAETALTGLGVKRGAIVVLDTKTNQVLAMANRSDKGPWDLPAVKAQVPGSVFKLVTAAAAFDSYRFKPDSVFDCPGFSQIPGVLMRCWTKHGRENLTDAIAESCDVAFAVVGTRVGRTGMETIWDRLHLSSVQLQSVDGRPPLREAEGGVLFRRMGEDNGLLANTAIGQEDVRLSPLQAANLASTIANGGLYRDAQLLLDAEKRGKAGRVYRVPRPERAFTPVTAYKLATGMRAAVETSRGTAHDLLQTHIPVAAKTGTAELRDGRVNAWLIGFLPVAKPEYAFCILAADEPSQTGHAAVHQIARRLLLAYRQFPPQGDIR